MPVDEKTFLSMVAKALGRDTPLAAPPKREEVGPPVFWREQTFEANQPLELFKQNLEALTGRVELVKSAAEATAKLEEWLVELNAQSIIVWDHPELRQYVKVKSEGRTVAYWSTDCSPDELKALADKADVGITWADYAIGYSGTIALLNGAGKGRSVSLLPPTHIAVFKREQLVPTMSYVISDLSKRMGTKDIPPLSIL